MLSMIKIKWNFVFDGPKRHRLWESRGQKEERERRGGAWRVEKTPRRRNFLRCGRDASHSDV